MSDGRDHPSGGAPAERPAGSPLRRLARACLRRLRGWARAADVWRHRRRLRRRLRVGSDDYGAYLDLQLERTVGKKDWPLPPRGRVFIERVAARVPLAGLDVLCVGCRNAEELDLLLARGARRVVGVDLFSEDPRILVMDMHRLMFPDASFDVVYSSHSFEHALDPPRAAREFLRVVRPGGYVAIEVPVNFTPRGADLRDYRSLEGVLAPFGDGVGEVLWSERVPPGDGEGTEALRVIARVRAVASPQEPPA